MYACDLCDYKAGEKQCLQEHIMSIHEGNYYLCYQCDHQATLKSSLIKHQTSFPPKYKIHICNETTKKKRICEICDYKAKVKWYFKEPHKINTSRSALSQYSVWLWLKAKV